MPLLFLTAGTRARMLPATMGFRAGSIPRGHLLASQRTEPRGRQHHTDCGDSREQLSEA